jgi:hypothetical protein
MTREEDLALVRTQIELGERGVESQRQVIKDLERSGHSTLLAKELLRAFEISLQTHYATHAFLMRREAAPHLVAIDLAQSARNAGARRVER